MMSRVYCFSCLASVSALLGPGCNPATPTTVSAKPAAPVKRASFDSSAIPNVKFVDITKDTGIRFVHSNGAAGAKLLPETMGSGVAFFDYDGDGDQDLLFVNSAPWPGDKKETLPTQMLYRNNGKGYFSDVTHETGLDQTFFGMGVAVGDYDNDGDPDLYFTTLHGGRLFQNDAGKFIDVTAETTAGAGEGWLTSATFFDVENDGDLDLFIACYINWSPETDRQQDFQLTGTGKGRAYGPPTAFNGSHCVLLRNDRGKFTDVSEAAGIRVCTPELKSPLAKSLGVAPFDVDGDGLVDLAVANDTQPNFFFHNLGNGKFEEMALTSGIAVDQSGSSRGAMGIDWAHFKEDGALGLAIGNFANEMMALYVTDQPKTLSFSDQANIFGLGAPTQPPMKFGLFFFDYDLDGRLDLLSTNGHLESEIEKVQASETYAQSAQLYYNTGISGPRLFTLVGDDKVGPDLYAPIVGRGSAYADIDGDGDLDVVLTANGGPARLLRNDGGNANHFLRLELIGKTSNRSAIGAKVRLEAGGKSQERQLFASKGYLSSVEFPLTFGLGKLKKVDRLEIRWPSGETTALSGLEAGKLIRVEEGKGVVEK